MGAGQSQPTFRPRYTQMEGASSPASSPSSLPVTNAGPAPRIPTGLVEKGDAPPQLARVESFSDKFIRKFSSQPLVPLGCMATAYFLVSGIKSFKDRDPVRSQKMMRARVGAQFVTLVIFMGYLGWEQLDFRLAPKYQDKKKHEQQLPTTANDKEQ